MSCNLILFRNKLTILKQLNQDYIPPTRLITIHIPFSKTQAATEMISRGNIFEQETEEKNEKKVHVTSKIVLRNNLV